MRTLIIQTKHLSPFAMDCLDNLTHSCVPAPPSLWPSQASVVAWWRQHNCTILARPALMAFAPLVASVSQIWSTGWSPDHAQPRMCDRTRRQKVFGIRLILGIRWCNRIAGQHTARIDCAEYVEAIIPAQAIGPAS